jgi:TrmH family RNA methyltransferase
MGCKGIMASTIFTAMVPSQITSSSNPRIKLIRKLRDRKERQQSGLFYIEGIRILAEAVFTRAELEFLVVAPELLTNSFGLKLLQDPALTAIPLVEVSPEIFNSFSLKEGPQGVGAVIHQRWTTMEEVTLADGRDWVALDAVADPGNLGSILRTSEAAGWAGAILLDHATDPYDPTAVRASMGAIFSQRLVKTSLDDFSIWKAAHHFPVIGAAGSAPDDYHHLDYPQPCILLMGSERQGLTPHHIHLCDRTVSIPMVGRSDSLNLSVATALVIYEIFNHRRDKRELS